MNYLLRKTTRRGVRELETDSEKVKDRAIKRGYVVEEPIKEKKGKKHETTD